jgi:hypothetical protein
MTRHVDRCDRHLRSTAGTPEDHEHTRRPWPSFASHASPGTSRGAAMENSMSILTRTNSGRFPLYPWARLLRGRTDEHRLIRAELLAKRLAERPHGLPLHSQTFREFRRLDFRPHDLLLAVADLCGQKRAYARLRHGKWVIYLNVPVLLRETTPNGQHRTYTLPDKELFLS